MIDWQNINTAPKTGIRVLLWDGCSVEAAEWCEPWYNPRGAWYTGYTCADSGSYKVDKPTQWAPINTPNTRNDKE